MSKSHVIIVLVGDDKVGKSSLIQSVLSESFPEKVVDVVPVVDIPPEMTPDHVPIQIVDTSNKDEVALTTHMQEASVVCVVYDISKPDTFHGVSNWLSKIRDARKEAGKPLAPVLLVGNKIDLRSEGDNAELEKVVTPIMNEFKEVETCIECSAKKQVNVGEMFHYAQKAVIYPTAVLFDAGTQKLKSDCIAALKRIFNLCDVDRDGILSDKELNAFQKRCFQTELSREELQGVKDVVSQSAPDGLKDDGLAFVGFLFLHHLFIQKGRMETTWTVLRTFGYNDELLLDPEFLVPELEDLKPGKVVELGDGMKFFEEGFTALDKDKDGKLSGDELDMLFSTAPDGNPWRKYDYQLSNDLKEVTLAQFKALWSMTTLHSYKTTLKYLAYLGYPDHQKEAVVIKSCRKEDLIKKKLSRSVLQGYVFGAQGSGKSSVLDRLANTAPFSAPPPNTSPKRVAVNQVNTTRGHKYLTLMEFTAETEKSILSSDKEMNACDVVVLVFDATSPKSVDNISKVYDQLQTSKRNLPVIVVGTKKDSLATDEAETAAANFCKSHLLNGPLMVSMKGETADLYQQILETATQDFQPETSRGSGWGKTLGLTVVGLAIVGGIAYAGKTYLWPKVSGNNK